MSEKFLSWVLRHNFPVDSGGWIAIEDFIRLAKELNKEFTIDHIKKIVATDKKQRFELCDGKVRAVQGHSLPQVNTIELCTRIVSKDQINGPVIHKTTNTSFKKILESGCLKPMGRNCIHFSDDPKLLRQNANVEIELCVEKWLSEGHELYRAKNGVILVNTDVKLKYCILRDF